MILVSTHILKEKQRAPPNLPQSRLCKYDPKQTYPFFSQKNAIHHLHPSVFNIRCMSSKKIDSCVLCFVHILHVYETLVVQRSAVWPTTPRLTQSSCRSPHGAQQPLTSSFFPIVFLLSSCYPVNTSYLLLRTIFLSAPLSDCSKNKDNMRVAYVQCTVELRASGVR